MDERRQGPTANQPLAALPAARVVSLSSAIYFSLRVQVSTSTFSVVYFSINVVEDRPLQV
jgi:hypothetical protein